MSFLFSPKSEESFTKKNNFETLTLCVLETPKQVFWSRWNDSVLVNLGKHPNMTENLLMGGKVITQTTFYFAGKSKLNWLWWNARGIPRWNARGIPWWYARGISGWYARGIPWWNARRNAWWIWRRNARWFPRSWRSRRNARWVMSGDKIFQYCTCPAGRVTYNFHLSCKHMYLSFKSICNKEHKGVICNSPPSADSRRVGVRLDMNISVDWDIKPQANKTRKDPNMTKKLLTGTYLALTQTNIIIPCQRQRRYCSSIPSSVSVFSSSPTFNLTIFLSVFSHN